MRVQERGREDEIESERREMREEECKREGGRMRER